jgi:hypothetical protein
MLELLHEHGNEGLQERIARTFIIVDTDVLPFFYSQRNKYTEMPDYFACTLIHLMTSPIALLTCSGDYQGKCKFKL